jgi:uncharacterized repeat protein (TIGR03803 family)
MAASVAAACAIAMLAVQSAQAQTYKEKALYSFTGGADGGFPYAGVIQDAKRNLYGTTVFGGQLGVCSGEGCGVVFKLDKAGNETVLHTFEEKNGNDGAEPWAGVIQDAEGNLYGTTADGGIEDCEYGCGIAFKISRAGKETVLHNFCRRSGCTDGANPYAGLIQGADGVFYGTTAGGGAYKSGAVFKLNKAGKETVLYSFCPGGPPCVDGEAPLAGVIQDARGNLYGTTAYGGDPSCGSERAGCGVIFKLSKTGSETVLYGFKGGSDGNEPQAGVVQDAEGNLYGTTVYGGDTSCNPPYGCGVVFRLSKTGELAVLHSFTGGADGRYPYAGVIQDAKGNLYGTTIYGGTTGCGDGCGVVFKLDKTGKKETVLHTFTGGTDGGVPWGAVIRDAEGNLYGTASQGGDNNGGVVFELKP